MIKIFITFIFCLSLQAREYYVGYSKKNQNQLQNYNVSKVFPNLEMALIETDNPQHLLTFDFHIKAPRKFTLETKSVKKKNETSEKLTNWGLDKINAQKAWRKTKGSGVNVLVLDSGIDRDHPLLAGKIIQIKDFTNSYQELGLPYEGYDITGHGTHVAGTILADNVGVAPEANLIVGKVCIFLCRDHRAMINAFEWALGEDIDIINMSFSSDSFPSEIAKRIAQKLEEKNIVAVAAAGNEGLSKNKISFPANQETILAVGAIDIDSNPADFSNNGPELDVVAPGVDILSLSLMKGLNATDTHLKKMSGTSMATPHTSGVAALVKSLYPHSTAKQIRGKIKNSVTLIKDDVETLKLINAEKAIN